MNEGDPLPIDVTKLNASTYAGCVITKPAVSPFIAAARGVGCVAATGTDMYESLQSSMLDFLLFRDAGS
jgi:shikimate dehydrogenase